MSIPILINLVVAFLASRAKYAYSCSNIVKSIIIYVFNEKCDSCIVLSLSKAHHHDRCSNLSCANVIILI